MVLAEFCSNKIFCSLRFLSFLVLTALLVGGSSFAFAKSSETQDGPVAASSTALATHPYNFKLTAEGDSTHDPVGGSVKGTSTLFNAGMLYSIDKNHTFGLHTGINYLRDYAKRDTTDYKAIFSDLSFRYEGIMVDDDIWKFATSGKIFIRPSTEGQDFNGDNGYIDIRFFADRKFTSEFQLKNELQLF
ncbi:MAG: hypothetical protein HQK53_12605, partial [Oligoflexia bacterium]|nr:hypothetical protein [Oligoflexia bacterium]